MKYTHALWLFILLALIIIMNMSNFRSPSSKERVTLDLEHANRASMEYLLDSYPETYLPSKVDWNNWKSKDLIEGVYSFKTIRSGNLLHLVFAKTQQDAIKLGEENFPTQTENLKWGVNGAVLFVVSGENPSKVSQSISHFAGEE